MAIIYFGAQVPTVTENGNWNQVDQWYSNPGIAESKSYQVSTPLGRLPLLTDQIILCQWVTSGVAARVLALTGVNNGIWTGQVGADYNEGANINAGFNDPAATWTTVFSGYASYINVRSGTVNFNFANSYEISGGTINGNVSNFSYITGGTLNGQVSGQVNIGGNPVFNGSLVNITTLTISAGTFTKAVTSWSGSGTIQLFGGTYNSPSSTHVGLGSVLIWGGTLAVNLFTAPYTIGSLVIFGAGTFSFSGNITIGAPGRVGQCYINNFYRDSIYGFFAGTDKNITVYGSSTQTYIRFGSISNNYPAGTYTGIITPLTSTGTGVALVEVNGGTYTPPVQTVPLINVAYGTGKGIDPSTLYKNPGFATYTQRVSISGSSDILQSELA